MRAILLGAAALSLLAAPVVAQDYSLSPNYGSVRLSAAFSPDPHQISLLAGGGTDAYTETNLPSACVGNISQAPDYEVFYDAGSFPLTFRTRSGGDTTLIINGPDGLWYCDDDSGGSLNARVRFARPASGAYHVWVGTFGENLERATLEITELD